jgi:hypothetical protein
MEWGSTVGYFALLESKSEQQLYEICARSRPAVKPPELSQEASQSGPINASTMLPWIRRLIAATARFESQSTSAQTNDTLTGNFCLRRPQPEKWPQQTLAPRPRSWRWATKRPSSALHK